MCEVGDGDEAAGDSSLCHSVSFIQQKLTSVFRTIVCKEWHQVRRATSKELETRVDDDEGSDSLH